MIQVESQVIRYPKDWLHDDIRIVLEDAEGNPLGEHPVRSRSVVWKGARTVCRGHVAPFMVQERVHRGVVTENGTPLSFFVFNPPVSGYLPLSFDRGVISASPFP